MKKILLLIIPTVLYICSFILVGIHEWAARVYGYAILYTKLFYVIFLIITGIFIAVLSNIYYESRSSKEGKILCAINITVPVIIGIILVKNDIMTEYIWYMMVYFEILGMYIYQSIRLGCQKSLF